MKNRDANLERRALILGTALTAVASAVRAPAQTTDGPATRLVDVPLSGSVTVTVERRGEAVLIGINRPAIYNPIDPPTRARLAEVLYEYEHDASLRAAVLFGHGPNFTRGIDVDAMQAALAAGRRPANPNSIDPTGKSQPRRAKPLVVVAHGDTWNLGHELYLAGDVRVAAANTEFAQDEN